jgi:plasmid stability protein
MASVLTIRDVPDDVKAALTLEARERGQSLQAYLLAVLKQQAAFSRNRQLLVEIERDLAQGGGAGEDAPDAADVLAAARRETTDGSQHSHGDGGAA